MRQRFHDVKDNPDFWKALYTWWSSLEHDRGQRATLRRADSPAGILIEPAYWRGPVAALKRAGIELDHADTERLALPVGILAHARALAEKHHFARQLALLGKGGQDVRDVRFRRLLAVHDEDRDGLYRMLIRLTRMLDGVVHTRSIVLGGFYWNDATRLNWARQYYTAPKTN